MILILISAGGHLWCSNLNLCQSTTVSYLYIEEVRLIILTGRLVDWRFILSTSMLVRRKGP